MEQKYTVVSSHARDVGPAGAREIQKPGSYLFEWFEIRGLIKFEVDS
jgi:hypothetical protein